MDLQHPAAPVEINFTFEEACKRLKVSRTVGYELVAHGRLRTFKLGARRYVTAGALDDFLRAAERAGGER